MDFSWDIGIGLRSSGSLVWGVKVGMLFNIPNSSDSFENVLSRLSIHPGGCNSFVKVFVFDNPGSILIWLILFWFSNYRLLVSYSPFDLICDVVLWGLGVTSYCIALLSLD